MSTPHAVNSGASRSIATWTERETTRALEIWAEYQQEHALADRAGETAGIDPNTGRVWLGESASDIWQQMDVEGVDVPLYFVRVGSDYYVRKGGRR
jgi:hypothetical protein